MRKFIFAVIIVFPLFGFSQKLTCADFKNGNFVMTSDQFPGAQIAIYRNGNIQTEKMLTAGTLEVEEDDYAQETIEWIGDCKYKLTLDEVRGNQTDFAKHINRNGGIITTILKIEGDCYIYESVVTINGKKEKVSGQVCKNIDY